MISGQSGQSLALTEDAIIRNRIQYDSRAMKQLLSRCSMIRPGDESSVRLALVELLKVHHGMSKYRRSDAMIDSELEALNNERLAKEQSIADARLDVVNLQARLEEAKILKANYLEYEAISNKVYKYPSRAKSAKYRLINCRHAINLHTEISGLQKEKSAVIFAADLRKKHFAGVIAAIRDMRAMINGQDAQGIADVADDDEMVDATNTAEKLDEDEMQVDE